MNEPDPAAGIAALALSAHDPAAIAGSDRLAAGRTPCTATVVHYGPCGRRVARRGEVDYSGLGAWGGTIDYRARDAGGVLRSQSTVTVDGDGRPQSAQTRLLDPTGALRGTIATDYRVLVCNPAGLPAAGSARFTVSDAQGQPTHRATMDYAGERPALYRLETLTNAAPEQLEVDFRKAGFAGLRLAGGALAVTRRAGAALTLASVAQSQLGPEGRPQRLHTMRFAPDGNGVVAQSNSDYSGIVFDSVGRILAGDLLVTSEDADGQVGAVTRFRFVGGRLVATFDGRRPVPPVPPSAMPATPANVPAALPWQPSRAPDRSIARRRPDGTLAQRSDDWLAPGSAVPMRSQIIDFAPDGSTPVRLTDLDYRAVRFDPEGNPRQGAIVAERFTGGARSSSTVIRYAQA